MAVNEFTHTHCSVLSHVTCWCHVILAQTHQRQSTWYREKHRSKILVWKLDNMLHPSKVNTCTCTLAHRHSHTCTCTPYASTYTCTHTHILQYKFFFNHCFFCGFLRACIVLHTLTATPSVKTLTRYLCAASPQNWNSVCSHSTFAVCLCVENDCVSRMQFISAFSLLLA